MNRGRVLIAGELLGDLIKLPAGYAIKKLRAVSEQNAPEGGMLVLEIEGPQIPPASEADPFADIPTIQMRYRRTDCGHAELESMGGLEPEAVPP